MNKPILMIWIFLTACQSLKDNRHDFILTEKDLIPEGLAVDARNGTIYIGATHKRKVITIGADRTVRDFIKQEADGIWSPVGMEIDQKRNILWLNTAHANQVMPLINPDANRDWMTALVAYDLNSRKQIVFKQLDEKQAFFNDLTVAEDGSIYITESVNNRIYRYSQEADSLELYLSFNGLNFPNGITSDDQNQFLFISTSEGIVRVDISGKHYALLEAAQQINAKQIDGLSYYKNSLIGHQSVKISRFYLTTDRSRIERVELLDSGPEFDSTTTGELDNNFYVYIVNSQIQSGVDYGKRAAKPFDSLENIIIRRIQL